MRLVFDVDGQRYVVARELRRAKAGRRDQQECPAGAAFDPTATGPINDADRGARGRRPVTAAVEKLLGLNFEHFCQCVVLPQGEFADFLHAKGPTAQRSC